MSLEPSTALAPPLLIDSDRALDRYLHTYPRVAFIGGEAEPGIGLTDWQSLGDDAVEHTWQLARTLGLPLTRLSDLHPDPEAIALIGPDMARQLRADEMSAMKKS